jgi:hypothetical protein
MNYTLIKLAFKVSDMANKASSDYLMSLCPLCHSAYFHYVDDLVLVYAIVKADFDTSVVAGFPVVQFDFEIERLKEVNECQERNVNILNGIEKSFFEAII